MMNSSLPGGEIIWGGKLQRYGDFFWSNPRNAARARFEGWLQMGMLQGRSQYGDDWKELMARAPVWNFLAPPNALNLPYGVVGSLAASFDRVGRQYPFMVGYVFLREMLINNAGLVLELPSLVNLTGHELHTAIRRAWPRAALESIWPNVLAQWRQGWAADVQQTLQQPSVARSEILDVLGHHASLGTNEAEMSTRPAMRESAYPWPDIMLSLRSANCPSFWWTNPAGGSPLKALAYESPLDGLLMTWLFGRGAR